MRSFLIDAPFDRKGWIFEIKWDGFRALAELRKKKVLLYSTHFKSFNERFPHIVQELKTLNLDAVLDGEIVALDAKGRPQFQLIQNYMRNKQPQIVYYVFDVLYLNGRELLHVPLIERKKILEELLPKKNPWIKYSFHIEEKGIAFFKEAKKKGLEGIMAKKAESPYRMFRSRDWLKIKAIKSQEVVIGGFTEPRKSRKKFGALLVGTYEDGKLKYAGHVGGGFTERALSEVYEKLKLLVQSKCPFSNPPRGNMPVTWVKPQLVCEVSFMNWTKEEIMRQPIFKGLREDKKSREVHREASASRSVARAKKGKKFVFH